MVKQCDVCGGDGKYKCPTCLVYYCCVGCCQAHRTKGCGIVTDRTRSPGAAGSKAAEMVDVKYPTADTVLPEKLEKLKDDKTISDLLCNPHLRDYLVEVNNSPNPEEMMQKAMQEPIFTELVEACLRIVEPGDQSID